MFDTKLFGYDKDQVEAEFDLLNRKINTQQKDIDYLRLENEKLNTKLKQSSKTIEEQFEK